MLVFSIFLAACAQGQTTEQEPVTETDEADVSEEAADVAQEVEELAGATGEELEEEAAEAGTAAAETGEEFEEEVAETGEELERGAEQVGTAAAETGEEIQEEADALLPQELKDIEGVTLSELDDNLDEYTGQSVGVRGDIVETIGTNAFQLSDPSDLGGDEILVIATSTTTRTFSTGNTIEVAGTVYRFDLPTIEEETGLDLQDRLFDDWDNDNAVLIAHDIINIAEIDDP